MEGEKSENSPHRGVIRLQGQSDSPLKLFLKVSRGVDIKFIFEGVDIVNLFSGVDIANLFSGVDIR